MFKDIDYTISLLNSNSSSWEENKTKVLIDLRENLDSGLREELIGITNATGTDLQWPTITDAIAAIRAIIHNKKFIFSINGIENQTLMGAELTVHIFSNPITTTTKQFVENIGDITNGKYITIKASEGLKEDGTVEPQPINISENLLRKITLGTKESDFPSLRTFKASTNRIEEVNISNLKSLKEIDLSNNNLRSIPDFSNVKGDVKVLILSSNKSY